VRVQFPALELCDCVSNVFLYFCLRRFACETNPMLVISLKCKLYVSKVVSVCETNPMLVIGD
jgi:hypothetical protein